jgi:ApaG protein
MGNRVEVEARACHVLRSFQSDFGWLCRARRLNCAPPVAQCVTQNIRVSVEAEFCAERSNVARRLWFFLYNIVIKNEGNATVQLLSRHWIITDANGETEEVKGPGVVGQQPVLRHGEAFAYTSGCPLRTPFGSMYGTYQMTNDAGEHFDIQIPPFALRDVSKMQ